LHNLPLTPRLIFYGDFNTFLQAKEKRQGTIVRDPSREYMEDLISVFDLADVKPKKCKYTWSNKRMGKDHIAARLDIFLVNNIFLEDNVSYHSNILSWGGSDHKPISLFIEPMEDYGPIPFRFNPLWAQDPSFLELVSHSWCHRVHGSPIYIWENKVKKLKYALKYWAKSVYNSPSSIIPKLLKEMESIQYTYLKLEISWKLMKGVPFSTQP
jgi:hypothetical protein